MSEEDGRPIATERYVTLSSSINTEERVRQLLTRTCAVTSQHLCVILRPVSAVVLHPPHTAASGADSLSLVGGRFVGGLRLQNLELVTVQHCSTCSSWLSYSCAEGNAQAFSRHLVRYESSKETLKSQ